MFVCLSKIASNLLGTELLLPYQFPPQEMVPIISKLQDRTTVYRVCCLLITVKLYILSSWLLKISVDLCQGSNYSKSV
jgi:hypothetical protein